MRESHNRKFRQRHTHTQTHTVGRLNPGADRPGVQIRDIDLQHRAQRRTTAQV